MPLNSFTQAYLQSVQLAHQQEQLENERKNAEAMVKLHQKQLDQTAQQHASDLKLRTAIAKQEMANHFQSVYGNTASTPPEISGQPTGDLGGQASGVSGNPQDPINFQAPQQQMVGPYNPNPQQPYEATPSQGWTPEMKQLFGPMMIDPQFQQKQLVAQKPALDAQAAQQQRLEDIKNKGIIGVHHAAAMDNYDRTIDLMSLKNQGAENVANIKDKSAEDRAHLAFLAALARIANTSKNEDPDDAEFQGSQLAGGNLAYNQVSAKSKPGVNTWMQTHGFVVPKDPKELAETMQAAHVLFDPRGVLDQYKDAIDNYSASGTLGAAGNFIAANNPMFGSKVKGVIENLQAQAGVPRQFFDKTKRTSDAEVLRTVKGIFDPTQSKDTNMKNYMDHVNSMANSILGSLTGLPIEQQNYIIEKEGLAGLAMYDKNGNKHPVFRRDSNGELRKFDPSDGTYVRTK